MSLLRSLIRVGRKASADARRPALTTRPPSLLGFTGSYLPSTFTRYASTSPQAPLLPAPPAPELSKSTLTPAKKGPKLASTTKPLFDVQHYYSMSFASLPGVRRTLAAMELPIPLSLPPLDNDVIEAEVFRASTTPIEDLPSTLSYERLEWLGDRALNLVAAEVAFAVAPPTDKAPTNLDGLQPPGQHLMTNVLLAKLAREFKFDERLKDTSEGNLACRFESYVGALAIVKDQQTVTEFLAPLFKRELMNMVRPKTLVVKTAPKPPTKVTATKTKAAKPSPKQPPYTPLIFNSVEDAGSSLMTRLKFMKLESSFRRTQKRLVFAPPGFKPVTEEAMGGMPGLIEAAKKLGSIVIRDNAASSLPPEPRGGAATDSESSDKPQHHLPLRFASLTVAVTDFQATLIRTGLHKRFVHGRSRTPGAKKGTPRKPFMQLKLPGYKQIEIRTAGHGGIDGAWKALIEGAVKIGAVVLGK